MVYNVESGTIFQAKEFCRTLVSRCLLQLFSAYAVIVAKSLIYDDNLFPSMGTCEKSVLNRNQDIILKQANSQWPPTNISACIFDSSIGFLS